MLFYSCIDPVVRSNSLLENMQLLKGSFAEFENAFMCLMTYFFCYNNRQYYLKFISKA